MDIDFVAELLPQHARRLSQLLGAEFYADAEAMERAIRARRAFNVIHIASSFKFDVFPAPDEPFYDNQLERRALAKADVYGDLVEFPVASAEDTVIAKLDWYRAGDELSEQQWRDLLGVVQIQGDKLDLAYLRRWAVKLHLEDLLDRLLASAR